MKSLIFLLIISPLFSFACDCSLPPLGIDFLQAKYVVWGQVTNKVFSEDSLSYTITFRVDEDFKKSSETPRALKFILDNNRKKDIISSCDYSINLDEKWLIYAFVRGSGLSINHGCSHSRTYDSFVNIDKEQREFLGAASSINLRSIIYSRLWFNNFAGLVRPNPRSSVESALVAIKNKTYSDLVLPHIEKIVLNIDSAGNATNIVFPRKSKMQTSSVYDVPYMEYTDVNRDLSDLQQDLLKWVTQIEWSPALFLGKRVNSQIMLEFQLKKDGVVVLSDVY